MLCKSTITERCKHFPISKDSSETFKFLDIFQIFSTDDFQVYGIVIQKKTKILFKKKSLKIKPPIKRWKKERRK